MMPESANYNRALQRAILLRWPRINDVIRQNVQVLHVSIAG